ncbi:MAG: hypothetical protein WKG07_14420 [Hymenobacter sp.]
MVKGCGQVGIVGALRGVAHVADAGVALQLLHVLGLEHVVHQPLPLVQVKGIVVKRGDAGGILPAVLEGGEADNHVAPRRDRDRENLLFRTYLNYEL